MEEQHELKGGSRYTTPHRPSVWQRLAAHLPSWLTNDLYRLFMKHVRPVLPDVNFITLHYTYFITTCLVSSLIFWGSSTPARSVRYIDSIFLCVSAMTEAGLNTVNLSTLNTWQQIIMFLLIMSGSAIFVSSFVLHVRKSVFERKLDELAERRERRKLHPLKTLSFSRSKRRNSMSNDEREAQVASGAVRGRAIKEPQENGEYDLNGDGVKSMRGSDNDPPQMDGNQTSYVATSPPRAVTAHIQFGENVRPPRHNSMDFGPIQRRATTHSIFDASGVGVHGLHAHPRNAAPPPYYDATGDGAGNGATTATPSNSRINKYFETLNGYIGRNSQFHHLTEKERRELGGIEYDAIVLLSWVIPLYFVLFQLFGAIGMGAWLQINRPNDAYENGLNPFWTGAFFAISAFNNSGMALLDANAVALQTSAYCLLTLSFLILAGNTCFPPFLRLILWMMNKCISGGTSPEIEKWKRVLRFILDHPRRVYTNLFPAKQTWWLVASLVLLNGTDWIAFEILNIGNPVTKAIPSHYRVLDGLFQAFAVRAGGFYVVNISGLYPGLLVLYVLMMYVSAFPVAMTIRNTNVYEERSLGLYAEDTPQPEEDDDGNPIVPPPKTRNLGPVIGGLRRAVTLTHGGTASRRQQPPMRSTSFFIRHQLRSQLSHDIWWLAAAILFITITETGQINRDPRVFSIFNIIFEVVSAYGTVGISTGVPWNAYSFSGAWHTFSKLILCAVMLRGRHRGLPVAIDKAVLLPHESMGWAEEEDAEHRKNNPVTSLSRATTTQMSTPERDADGHMV